MAAGAGILIIAAATLLGVIATIVTKKDPGTILGALIVVGALAAAIGVRYSTAYILIPIPALAWVAGAGIAGYVHDRSLLTGSIGYGSQAAVWMAAGFTWMVIAIVAVIVVAAGRYAWVRRNRMVSSRDRPAPAGAGPRGAAPMGAAPGGVAPAGAAPGGAAPAGVAPAAFRDADAAGRPSRGPAPRFTPASAADPDRPASGRPAPGSARPGPDSGRPGPDSPRGGYARPGASAPPLPGDTRRPAPPRRAPQPGTGTGDSDDDAYRRYYDNDDTWR
jgi:hypothetical protein